MVTRYKVGEEDNRPWGHWIVLDTGAHHTVKRITVKPDARLSLQYHHGREEYWTCVSGEGVATVGDADLPLRRGITVHIPVEAHHRMSNSGTADMVIIETQIGEVLDEDDIVRIEDDFGRV